MRILHLLAYHLFSGPAAPTAALAMAQREAGHQVWLAWDTHRGPPRYEEPIGPRMLELELAAPVSLALSTKAPPWVTLGDRRRLVELAGRVDVIHSHMSHDHALAASLRRSQRPLLVRTLHAARSFAPRLGQRWLLGRADGLIARAPAHAEALRDRFGLVRVEVIPAGISAVRWTLSTTAALEARQNLRSRLGLADGPVAILAAMMQAGRGHDALLAAWRIVQERLPTASLLLAGEGEQQVNIARAAAGLRVHQLGYLPHEELRAAYACADLALLLTPGNDLGGRTVLEAMACGRPVLVADGEGDSGLARAAIVQAARESGASFVAGSDEPTQLAAALVAALGSSDLVERGVTAQRHVLEQRTVRAEATRTLSWYDELSR